MAAYRQQLVDQRERKSNGISASIRTMDGSVHVSVPEGKTVVFKAAGREAVDIFDLKDSFLNAITNVQVQSLIDDEAKLTSAALSAAIKSVTDKVAAAADVTGRLSKTVEANRQAADTTSSANERAIAELANKVKVNLDSIRAVQEDMIAVKSKVGDGVDGVEKKVDAIKADLDAFKKQTACNVNFATVWDEKTGKCEKKKNPGSSKDSPAVNTAEILRSNPNAASGTYWIRPDSTIAAEAVYVDMSPGYKGYMKVISLCGTGLKTGLVNLGTTSAVAPGADWTKYKNPKSRSCGKVSNAFWAKVWSRKKFLLRVEGPSDRKFLNNGAGTSEWTAENGKWPMWGTSTRPQMKHKITLDCNNDGKADRWETYTRDGRGTCGYHPKYWLYDHNYSGNPQCYGFGASSFGTNLHFMGLCNSANKVYSGSGGSIWHRTTTIWVKE